jgi:hypothetical protein
MFKYTKVIFFVDYLIMSSCLSKRNQHGKRGNKVKKKARNVKGQEHSDVQTERKY